jgi:hypothetical protein
VQLQAEENQMFGQQNDISQQRLDLQERALQHKIATDKSKPSA